MDNVVVGKRPYVFVRGGSLEASISAIYCAPAIKSFILSHSWSKISEYDVVDSYHLHIDLAKKLPPADSILTCEQLHSTIIQCRALRTIAYHRALNFIRAAEQSVLNFIRTKNPTFFLGFSIDNYVLDILYTYLAHYSIPFLSVTCTPLSPKHVLNTVRGELNPSSWSGSVLTCAQLESKLLSNSRNPRSNPSLQTALPITFKLFIKVPIYFLRYAYSRLFGIYSYEYYFALSMIKFTCPNLFSLSISYSTLSDLHSSSPEKVAYIPLSVYPEATIDYWTNMLFNATYEDYILSIISGLIAHSFTVCLKAHPYFPFNIHQSILRSVRKRHHDLLMMRPSINGLDMIKSSSLVVALSGTSAFQSLLLKTDILALKNTLYTHHLESEISGISLPPQVSFYPASKNSKNLQVAMNAYIASHI